VERAWDWLALSVAAALVCGVALTAATADDQPPKIMAYINTIPKESPEARAERHRLVAERRQNTPIMVHRGASKIAPENTLEAYAAAMDRGADGVEIDIRRSKDGVLYLMHDDDVHRTTFGGGKGSEMTYSEIASCKVRGAGDEVRVPTFAALLVLARQRAMLLHLDVKEPGLQDDIIKMLDEADVWDHLAEVNGGNADRIRNNEKTKLLQYKGWFPQDETDPNSDAVKNFLASDGNMVFCKYDPTVVAQIMGRKPVKPVPLPKEIYEEWGPGGVSSEK
jgi:hypothetical protein